MVCDPEYRAVSGGFPPQGGTANIGETNLVLGGKDLGIIIFEGSNTGGWFRRYVDLHLQAPEYDRAIPCNITYYGTLPVGRADAGIKGSQELLVSGGTGSHRYTRGR